MFTADADRRQSRAEDAETALTGLRDGPDVFQKDNMKNAGGVSCFGPLSESIVVEGSVVRGRTRPRSAAHVDFRGNLRAAFPVLGAILRYTYRGRWLSRHGRRPEAVARRTLGARLTAAPFARRAGLVRALREVAARSALSADFREAFTADRGRRKRRHDKH